jgi:hypothetical protein
LVHQRRAWRTTWLAVAMTQRMAQLVQQRCWLAGDLAAAASAAASQLVRRVADVSRASLVLPSVSRWFAAAGGVVRHVAMPQEQSARWFWQAGKLLSGVVKRSCFTWSCQSDCQVVVVVCRARVLPRCAQCSIVCCCMLVHDLCPCLHDCSPASFAHCGFVLKYAGPAALALAMTVAC